ncbi:MAG: hypothetical protein QM765_34095 [Myxococcales bacterium]
MFRTLLWCLLAAFGTACAPTLQQRRADADQAIKMLQAGSFDEAEKRATITLAADEANPFASGVRAIARYKRTMHQLALDVRTTAVGAVVARGVNQRYLEATFGQAEQDFAAVEADLAKAAAVPGFALELCLACWKVDWNGNGRIEDSDQRLMEIEEDADGHPIPEGDPQRRPTFRFDDGDVAWARAFVGFGRALLDLALAYNWSGVNQAFARGDEPPVLTIALTHPERIAQAKQRALEALEQSDLARKAYLAETDDDREWAPNPRQKSHPIPLPVDEALYATWEGLLGDLRKLVKGEEGIDLAEVVALAGEKSRVPTPEGCIDLGTMLSKPKDLVLDLGRLKAIDDDPGRFAAILGPSYLHPMKASKLPGRLARMKGEIERNEERFERKLRYLLWLN